MKKLYIDRRYQFYELFNTDNGTLVRSNIWGTDKNPFRRSFPELIDVGIMGSCLAGKSGICAKAGIDCYQRGATSLRRDMNLQDYEWIVKQSRGKVFQIALGGAGDPNKHESFEQILKVTRDNDIVPNLTTSGYQLTDDEIGLIKQYCGAVAVSYYSKLIGENEGNETTIKSIERLSAVGCITNVHYVVSNDSIEEAIVRLEKNMFPDNINAVIFLLYKPVGLGSVNKIVRNDVYFRRFIEVATSKSHPFKVGFDTCFTPALINYGTNIDFSSVDACEAARFSMYIDSELNAFPCSFDNLTGVFKFKLANASGSMIEDAWNSDIFKDFLNRKAECCNCDKENWCYGGCRLSLPINLCNNLSPHLHSFC